MHNRHVCTALDKQAATLVVSLCLLSAFWLLKRPPAWASDRAVSLVDSEPVLVPNTSAVLATHSWLQNGQGLQQLQPSVHGYVKKAGMAERLHWSQTYKYAVAREAIFRRWRQNSGQQGPAPLQPGQNVTCAAARHPPVPHHHCHVFVNHQYRIAYIRSPKSSSTSIMNWLGQCNYNKTRNWNSTTCMHYTWEKYENLASIKQIWQNYFFFGFIRNPWNRAYSLYKDMTATNHFKHRHGPQCQLEWGDFCRNPFTEFEELHRKNCTHVAPHYAYWHMMDQYHCMITPSGEWAVDFLGRVEAGDTDWRTVVDEMNRRRLPGVPEVAFSSYGHIHSVPAGAQPPPVTRRHRAWQHHSNNRLLLRRLLGPSVEYDGLDAAEDEGDGFTADDENARGGDGSSAGLGSNTWGTFDAADADGTGPTAAAAGAGGAVSGGSAGSACSEPSAPYCDNSLHCIDAVSQWYACDVEHFGYLPLLPTPPGADEEAAAAAAAARPTASPLTAAAAAAAAAAVVAARDKQAAGLARAAQAPVLRGPAAQSPAAPRAAAQVMLNRTVAAAAALASSQPAILRPNSSSR